MRTKQESDSLWPLKSGDTVILRTQGENDKAGVIQGKDENLRVKTQKDSFGIEFINLFDTICIVTLGGEMDSKGNLWETGRPPLIEFI